MSMLCVAGNDANGAQRRRLLGPDCAITEHACVSRDGSSSRRSSSAVSGAPPRAAATSWPFCDPLGDCAPVVACKWAGSGFTPSISHPRRAISAKLYCGCMAAEGSRRDFRQDASSQASRMNERWSTGQSFVTTAFFAGNAQCQRRRVAQSTSCSCLDLPLVSTLPSVLSSVVGVANDSVIQTVIPHAALRWARPSTRAAPEAVMRRAPWQEIWLRPSAAFGDHRGRCRRAARGRASPKPTRTEPQ
jgi:hypothetical protein